MTIVMAAAMKPYLQRIFHRSSVSQFIHLRLNGRHRPHDKLPSLISDYHGRAEGAIHLLLRA